MKRTVRLLFLFICNFSLLASPVVAAEPDDPLDSSIHWSQPYVAALADKGVIPSTEAGSFQPDALVTTGQFTVMILRGHYGDISPTDESPESAYINLAYEKGVLTDGDLQNADLPLYRAAAARIGHEALLKIFGEADEQNALSSERLPDLYAETAAAPHIAQFFAKGIVTGRPDGSFHGGDTLTNAEAAVITMKMIDPAMRAPKMTAPQSDEGRISPDEALGLLKNDETVLFVDVRSEEEHKAGYIPGSINIPLPLIVDNLETSGIPPEKNTTVILYCQKGSKSLRVFKILTAAGYKNVYNVGGIEDWPYEITTATEIL